MKEIRNKTYSMLRWSEKYTQTDMVYAVKGGFWLSFGQLFASVSAFILSIFFAHLVNQETFGTYKYILSLAGLVGAFSLSGLGTAVTRAIAQGFEGDFIKSFWLNIRWGFLTSIISIGISIYYFINGNSTLGVGMLIASCFSPLLDSFELYGAIQNGKKDFKGSSLYRVVRSLLSTLGLIATLFITQNPIILVLAYFFINTTILFFIFTRVYSKYQPNKITSTDTVSLGKHLSVINSIATFADKVDQVLVFHFLGPIQLAIYNYATAIPNNIASLTKNIGTIATPKYAVIDKNLARSTIFRKSFIIFLYALPITIIYFFFANLIFKTFFPQYLDSVFYSQIYALTLFINGSLPIAFLDAHKAIKEKYILSLTSNIFKIVVMLVGLYFFGLIGLIIARIASKLFGLVLSWFLIFKV